MNDYYEVRIAMQPCCEDATDLAAACLAEIGFESFVPDSEGLTAYIKKEDFSEEAIRVALSDFPFDTEMSITASLVPGQDWNAEWEKNYFKPIVVAGKCVVHSTFHTDVPTCEYDIAIDPKMAFGTGHHSTTALMIEQLLSMDLEGDRVADVGTGTGILAILACMRGAAEVVAIEIDEGAYLNALENAQLQPESGNYSPNKIVFVHGNASHLTQIEPVDVLIANINRNIIITDLPRYEAAMKPGGTMLLSGFYEEDADMVAAAAQSLGLEETARFTKEDRWTLLRLVKPY